MTSIRCKMFLWFGLVLLVLLTGLTVTTYYQVKNTVIPLTKDSSQEIVLARSAEMGRLLEGYLNDIRTISRRNVIRSGDFDAISEDLSKRSHIMHSDYEMLFFADALGNYITTTGSKGNVRDRDYFKAVMNEDLEEFISNPIVSRASGEYVFVAACPVFDDQGNKMGLMAATVLLETLSGIAESINISHQGFGYVVDQAGLLIAHPDQSLRMKLNLLESAKLGFVGLEAIGKAMSEAKPGISSYQRPDGSTLMAVFHPIPNTPGWSLGISLNEQKLMGTADRLTQNIVYLMLGVIVAVLVLVYFISGRIASPILALQKGVQKVSSGNLDHSLNLRTGDEIQQLAESFNKMTVDLQEHIRILQQTTAEKERIESELQVANQIQSSMLPRLFPPFPNIDNLDLYATMKPAREVGGDFYDFFLIDDRRLCFNIGDVSDKGVGAALFMVITRTILKNQALQGNSLSEIFYQTNNMLCADNAQNMFVTVFMGILDIDTGELEYVCAGHNPPLILHKGQDFQYLDRTKSLVLGAMEDFSYTSFKTRIEPGDMLFLYTDGVTEAMNEMNELFDEQRMFQALNSLKGKDARQLITGVQEEIEKFVQGTPASDDVTMLALSLQNVQKVTA